MTKNAVLQDGTWLTRERLQIYPRALLCLTFFFFLNWAWSFGDGMVNNISMPRGIDFLGFWAASWVELHKGFVAVYDNEILQQAETMAVGQKVDFLGWFYPPTAGLLVLPLALMPYGVALLTWWGCQLILAHQVLRRTLDHPHALAIALAFPPVVLCLFVGQNALLTAGLLGGGLLLLPKRPLLAGLVFSCLCYKPHLALMVPVALLAGRQWRALSGGILGCAIFCAASLAVAGMDGWGAFLTHGAYAQKTLENGWVMWGRMVSFYAGTRALGLPSALAWGAQAAGALAAALFILRLWSGPSRFAVKAAGLAAAGLVVPPFILDYDLIPLGLAIVWLVKDGLDQGFLPWEKTLLASIWFLPGLLLSAHLFLSIGTPLAPLLVLSFLWLVWRRRTANSFVPPSSCPTSRPGIASL